MFKKLICVCDLAYWNNASLRRLYLDRIITQMQFNIKYHCQEHHLAVPDEIITMLCASFSNMSRLVPHTTWFSKFLVHVMAPAMTRSYINNVFPMLRQLCAIVRIDCSHRTTKNRREKQKYKVYDPTTKQFVTKVRVCCAFAFCERSYKTL